MKIILIFLLLGLTYIGYTQTYKPIIQNKSNELTCLFTYSYTEGANRPSAYVVFSDNYNEISLNAVCSENGADGTNYSWCVRGFLNGEMIDIAYLDFKFEQRGRILKVKILKNKYSYKYLKYLKVMEGHFIKSS